ncbi:hypothetical protein MPH_02424 [Macrophomina phaseolina MS6]|uniref:Uncharacterized protein n=1 Tax=Macrophomina phaseolina (strain MS6) TaxID=1126212 RepID=K2RCP4_MACPH|nr:hypothetical protein MPH_02424 [Macrophomina phaseolina MS6]
MLSGSQGSLQLLQNNNAFIGWGKWPFFSEHSANGTTVLWGQFAANASDTDIMSYRVRKFDWTATPHDSPTMFAYSRNASAEAGTVLYVSWNGATEVAAWRFYHAVDAATDTGQDMDGRAWRILGTANKTGFETRFRTREYAKWVFAEAVGKDGKAIRRSRISKVFVPSGGLRDVCDEWGCPAMLPDPAASINGKLKADKVNWGAIGHHGEPRFRTQYPPQPPAELPSLAWQVVPQLIALALVFGFIASLWAAPKLYTSLERQGKRKWYQEAESTDNI